MANRELTVVMDLEINRGGRLWYEENQYLVINYCSSKIRIRYPCTGGQPHETEKDVIGLLAQKSRVRFGFSILWRRDWSMT